MVVVSVALALWICVVWWQDHRTAKAFDMPQHDADAKLEMGVEEPHESKDPQAEVQRVTAPVS